MKRISHWIGNTYVLEDDSPCSRVYKIFNGKKEVEDYLNKQKALKATLKNRA